MFKNTQNLLEDPMSSKWGVIKEQTNDDLLPSLSESGILESDDVQCVSSTTLEGFEAMAEGDSENVKSLCYFNMDFNTDRLTLELAETLLKQAGSLNILSAEQGDILCITNMSYTHRWTEGYLAKDPKRELGLTHLNFIKRF
jgi:hypothetical protein